MTDIQCAFYRHVQTQRPWVLYFSGGKVIDAVGPLTEECRRSKHAYECTEPVADLTTFTLGGLVLDDENHWQLQGVRAAGEWRQN